MGMEDYGYRFDPLEWQKKEMEWLMYEYQMQQKFQSSTENYYRVLTETEKNKNNCLFLVR